MHTRKLIGAAAIIISVLLCGCIFCSKYLDKDINRPIDADDPRAEIIRLKEICSIDKSELPVSAELIKRPIITDDLSGECTAVFNELHEALKEQPEYTEIRTDISLDDAIIVSNHEYFCPETFSLVHRTGMRIRKWDYLSRIRYTPTYSQTLAETEKMREKLNQLCDNLVYYAQINGYADTPEDIAAFSCMWLSQHCKYRHEKETPLDCTAYGALVDDVAICSGYTAAFNLIMLRAGYDAYHYVGQSGNAFHAWSGYTGSDSVIHQCDATRLAGYKDNEVAGWDVCVDFVGNNGEFSANEVYHYLNSSENE